MTRERAAMYYDPTEPPHTFIIEHPKAGAYMIAHPYLEVAPTHPRPLSAPEPLALPGDSPLFDWPEEDVRYQSWCDLAGATYMPKSGGHDPDIPSTMWWACEYPERQPINQETVFFARCDACYIAMLSYVASIVDNDQGLGTSSTGVGDWTPTTAVNGLESFEQVRTGANLWVWRDGRRMVPA